MNGIPSEWLMAGGIVLILLAAWVIWKFGKQIMTFILVIAGLIVVGALAWALLQQPDVIPDDAARAPIAETIDDLADIARVVAPPEERAARSAPIGTGGGGFVAGLLTAEVVAALGVGGYFYARWKFAERGGQRMKRNQRIRTDKWMDDGATMFYFIADENGEYNEDPVAWEDEWIGDLFQL